MLLKLFWVIKSGLRERANQKTCLKQKQRNESKKTQGETPKNAQTTMFSIQCRRHICCAQGNVRD